MAMELSLSSSLACVLATLLVLGLVHADVGVAEQQRLRLQQLSYPAAGFKPARQFPLPAAAAQPQSERLVANSEAQEDLDDAAEEVTTRPKIATPVPAPVPAAAPVTPTIAYYPAGAVGFVHPTTYAQVLGAPQLPQAAYAKVLAAPQLQPQPTAAYVNAPQYYAAYFG
ncbi:uncharacterized protein LOC117589094 [Drosophila guanche]|uniref:DUF4794 domain-containing protein n=1 Tax=Drosophila guanche TaxID=7266 RepID=A0A3B0KQB5_DROGU|nr:uncharacterized protein LOC117589094 [Drosophila guanche]SPP87401.1 Hypothetical predicted protein [Drosophila guanche]